VTAGDGQAVLNWNPNPPGELVDRYQVYRATFCPTGIAEMIADGPPGTTYTDTGLTNGTTYYYRLSAHNATGYTNGWTDPCITAVPTASGTGCVEPTVTTDRWLSCASAFNTPIPANAVTAPDNASMLLTWEPQGTNNYNNYWLGPRGGPGLSAAAAVSYASTSTPAVTVQLNFPTCASATYQVQIPAGTDVGDTAHSENKLVSMLPDGSEWDFFDITAPGVPTFNYSNEGGPVSCPTNSNWQTLVARDFSPGWTGTGTAPVLWSDSGILESAGIIRKTDITNTPVGGNWGHALVIDYSGNCASGQTHPSFVSPAISGDGVNTGITCAPMGARWQLDPSISCDTWPSMANQAEWLKQMCRTLQVYGGITAHSASCQGCGDGVWTEWYKNLGGWFFPWQDQTTGAIPDYYSASMNIPSDLLSHFRVIAW